MICNKCKREIPGDSKFCQYCGNRLKDFPAHLQFNESNITPRKKTAKKKWAIVIVTILSLLIICALTVFVFIPGIKYSHAKKLLESGEYDLAYSAFSKLGTFNNADDMLVEIRYLTALKHWEDDNFEYANLIFSSLGDYKNSKIFIHKHDYILTSQVEATCTTAGSETFKCFECNDSYVNSKAPAHKYVVVNEVVATCTSAGRKEYQCSVCGNTYSELIEMKSHDYTVPTCSTPQTCKVCGKTDGSGLGHTDTLVCTRCGESTFETLEFSGYGVGNVTGFDLPKGNYRFTFTHSGYSNFIVHYYNGSSQRLIVNEIGKVSYIHSEYSLGDRDDRYFNIIHADGYWTLTIEAVGN